MTTPSDFPSSTPASEPTMAHDFPRRIQTQKWVPAERAIQDAVNVVEGMAADIRLTDAVCLLGAARDRVADFVDGVEGRRTLPVSAPSEPPTLTPWQAQEILGGGKDSGRPGYLQHHPDCTPPSDCVCNLFGIQNFLRRIADAEPPVVSPSDPELEAKLDYLVAQIPLPGNPVVWLEPEEIARVCQSIRALFSQKEREIEDRIDEASHARDHDFDKVAEDRARLIAENARLRAEALTKEEAALIADIATSDDEWLDETHPVAASALVKLRRISSLPSPEGTGKC